MFSPNSSSMGSGKDIGVEELVREDVRRSHQNKMEYGRLYDPWSDESPAAISAEQTLMLKRQLREVH